MKVLVTGGAGFVGGHLLEALLARDDEVLSIDRVEAPFGFLSAENRKRLMTAQADLTERDAIAHALVDFCPDGIIHLASFSSVSFSWQHPNTSFRNNMNIYLNLLEAVRNVCPHARVLAVGSSEQYGNVSEDKLPLRESTPMQPVSPYAVARVAQEHMSRVYVEGYDLDIVSTRSFNHYGPRQPPTFVLPAFAKQIAEILARLREPRIEVGDLSIVRDFVSVTDVVRAYLLLLEKGVRGETYNICSGVGRTLEACLDHMIELAAIDCNVVGTSNLSRPIENRVVRGSYRKLLDLTGWQPAVAFEAGMATLLEDWRQRVGSP